MMVPSVNTRRLTASSVATFDETVQQEIDSMWLMIGAILIFFMQVGFAMIEVGSVATKNARHILIKNLVIASVVAVVFGLFAYGLAFGDTSGANFLYGFVGKDMFYFKSSDYDDGYGYNYASWLFHWSFASLTATISVASMAERISFRATVLYSIFLIAIIYPPIACAIWNNQGFGSARRSENRFFGCGVIDFAGSGVVHMTGGISSLIGVILVGPRRSFLTNEAEISTYGNIFQTLGTLVLWFGWYGHNAVSSMHLVDYAEVASKTMVMTTVAAALGGLSSVIATTFSKGKDDEGEYHLRLEGFNRGIIAGLVGISASCSVVEPYGAAATGLVCGGLSVAVDHYMNDWGMDDVLGAFSIHGVCGMFGMLMPGLLATPHNYGNAYSEALTDKCSGLLYGGDGNQLYANVCGLLIILVWVSLTSAVGFGVLKKLGILRISDEAEDESMDLSEHDEMIMLASRAKPSSIKDLVVPPEENPPKPRTRRQPRPSQSGRGNGSIGDASSPRASQSGGRGGKGGRGKVPPPEGSRRVSRIVQRDVELTSSV